MPRKIQKSKRAAFLTRFDVRLRVLDPGGRDTARTRRLTLGAYWHIVGAPRTT